MVLGPNREDRIDRAIRRLDRAATVLEQRLGRRIAQAQAQGGSLADSDRARLAAELDAARARERELEAAGAEASQALANAIEQLRAALKECDRGKHDSGEGAAPWAG
jgi:hypothetical protein